MEGGGRKEEKREGGENDVGGEKGGGRKGLREEGEKYIFHSHL